MKVTVGAHPDLPMPFSNGPEPPPDPVRGLAEPLPLATERYEAGVTHMAALVNYWLDRSNLSHAQMVAICHWGLGEDRIIDETVLSKLRNRRIQRGASIKHLDAMACGNRAIWLWQTQGQGKAWAELGPHVGWGVREEWLASALWLPSAADDGQPLGFDELAEVLAGYLDLPYLPRGGLSPIEATRLSQRLAELLEGEITRLGVGLRQGIAALLEAYPVDDQVRQRRLKAVLTGDVQLSRDDVEMEQAAIAEAIRVLRGLPVGGYGPAELQAELLDRR